MKFTPNDSFSVISTEQDASCGKAIVFWPDNNQYLNTDTITITYTTHLLKEETNTK